MLHTVHQLVPYCVCLLFSAEKVVFLELFFAGISRLKWAFMRLCESAAAKIGLNLLKQLSEVERSWRFRLLFSVVSSLQVTPLPFACVCVCFCLFVCLFVLCGFATVAKFSQEEAGGRWLQLCQRGEGQREETTSPGGATGAESQVWLFLQPPLEMLMFYWWLIILP